MKTLCPNCKADSDLVTIEQVDYINCPECGWFETFADGSVGPCEPPQAPKTQDGATAPEPEDEPEILNPPEPADQLPEGDHIRGQQPPSGPPVPTDEDSDDEDSVTVKINFED